MLIYTGSEKLNVGSLIFVKHVKIEKEMKPCRTTSYKKSPFSAQDFGVL